jgi:signal transduction histidine kinase
LNLLSNAIKYTSAGGKITIQCSASAQSASIAVQDTGRGVPQEKLESIFEPFVQLGRSLSSPHEGMGLGLAISRDLARAMGGDLTVSSVVGRGSTFTLTLPRAS